MPRAALAATFLSFALGSALQACGGDDASEDVPRGPDAASDAPHGDSSRADARPVAQPDAGDADVADDASLASDATDAGSLEAASDATIADTSAPTEAGHDAAPVSDGAADTGALDADADAAFEAGPRPDDASPDDARTDAPLDAADAGPLLPDVCTDDEWRAITKPLALVGLTVLPSHEAFVLIDLDGHCRRWVNGSPTWIVASPNGRALAWASADGLRAGGRLATVAGIGTPTSLPDGIVSFRGWSPDSNWLAFTIEVPLDGSSTETLYTIRADGSGLRHIADSVGEDFAWSPDSTRFAFTRGTDADWQRLHIDCPDHDCSLVASAANNYPGHPLWSPDSKRIVVESAGITPSQGQFGLFVVDATTGTIRQASYGTDPNEVVEAIQWSASGERISYVSHDTSPGQYWIWDVGTLCADGSCRTSYKSLVPGGISQMDANPVWSPDGARIAFSALTGPFGASWPRVHSVCTDGSCAADLGPGNALAWTSNSYVIHESREGDAGTVALFASCNDGSCTHRLGGVDSYGDARDWQAAHAHGAVAFLGAGAISVSTDMITARRLSLASEAATYPLAWSPDDAYVVYTTGTSTLFASLQAACADGSCHSTVVASPIAGTVANELRMVLAAPSP